jgi:hypothetical protein
MPVTFVLEPACLIENTLVNDKTGKHNVMENVELLSLCSTTTSLSMSSPESYCCACQRRDIHALLQTHHSVRTECIHSCPEFYRFSAGHAIDYVEKMGEPFSETSNPEVDFLLTSQPAQSASLYPIKLGSNVDFLKVSEWSLVADEYLRTRSAHFSKLFGWTRHVSSSA